MLELELWEMDERAARMMKASGATFSVDDMIDFACRDGASAEEAADWAQRFAKSLGWRGIGHDRIDLGNRYELIRRELARDLLNGVVRPDRDALRRHLLENAGVGAAEAGELADRFLWDLQRHLDRKQAE